MSQYIDKDALVAEIEQRKNKNQKICTSEGSGAYYEDGFILDIINTLEVKEVDLEEELDEWMKYGPHTSYPWCTIPDAIEITAKHFFELGLNAQK